MYRDQFGEFAKWILGLKGLIRKTKLTISIQIDSTLKEVLLRWAK